jgi:spore germination protein PB
MTIVVHQSISIHQLKVDSMSNSCVLQIGTSGIIRALSNLYNTGGYTGPAPMAEPGVTIPPLVPLPEPTP